MAAARASLPSFALLALPLMSRSEQLGAPALRALARPSELSDAFSPHQGLSPAERLFLSVPSNASARSSLRFLTAEAHVAGTAGDLKMAKFVHRRFADEGLDARIDAVRVLLSYPDSRSLKLLDADGRPVYTAGLSEAILPSDATSDTWWRNHTFNGYAPSGNASAQLVYANFGLAEDFDALRALGIDVRGKLVLVRYGQCFRGLKVLEAQRAGALGVLIYSDPQQDGFDQGPTYPSGPWRPKSSVQRGSVQFNSLCAGDPSRLYLNGTVEEVCGYKQAELIPAIPVLPISWGDAEPLLRALLGPEAPARFCGGLALTYRVGPSRLLCEMRVENRFENGTIWNVIGVLRGSSGGDGGGSSSGGGGGESAGDGSSGGSTDDSSDSNSSRGSGGGSGSGDGDTPAAVSTAVPAAGDRDDQPVLLGNHRDAWVFGAADPNSGTAALLEVVRGVGAAVRSGWRPRRSLVFCSWSGEEYGLLGSTAFAELQARTPMLQRALAYLNVDVGVSGNSIRAAGTPSLRSALEVVLRHVDDPRSAKPLAETWEGELEVLGSGSDYTAFIDALGIPSLDLSFRPAHAQYGVYHSTFDSFSWMTTECDPTFEYHVAMSRAWGLLAIRLAGSAGDPLLPVALNATAHATAISSYIESVGQLLNASSARRVGFSGLEGAQRRFAKSAADVAARAELLMRRPPTPARDEAVRALNEKLCKLERCFLSKRGLPGRKWFKHVLQAPGLRTGYAAQPLPAVHDAISSEQWDVAKEQVEIVAARLLRATKTLDDRIESERI